MFKKMDINGAALRILTLACYFLPFIFFFSTCVDGVGRTAYNKADAIKNEKDKVIAEKKDLIEAAANLVADKITVSDSGVETTSETIKLLENADDAWLLNPTLSSASAIGFVLMYDDAFPRLMVFLSALLSLLTFLMWRFLKRKGWVVYIIGANLFSVVAFMMYCFASNVTVLYGAYLLVFLLIVQLLSTLQDKKKQINATLEGINPN
jgi:hypothetical protein